MTGRSGTADGYSVTTHCCSSAISFSPSTFVDSTGAYLPSKDIVRQIGHMWNRRNPRNIGQVSEKIAEEILTKACLMFRGTAWVLTSEKLKSFLGAPAVWKPDYGIYCDDVIVVAEANGDKLLFPTEVKGTTLQTGLPRSMEAKIFYQLARTCHTI